jgi:hypothetical protein
MDLWEIKKLAHIDPKKVRGLDLAFVRVNLAP